MGSKELATDDIYEELCARTHFQESEGSDGRLRSRVFEPTWNGRTWFNAAGNRIIKQKRMELRERVVKGALWKLYFSRTTLNVAQKSEVFRRR